ncbi:MAG TPA: lysylphosphatidylglycerol synthase transmembrane domain-containing protein [Tenuifilaceae bacterium]|nr:lysylphosphatidylglycerol synthase transmembrane domain-containing protein [Tenuifilaceae bacterium]
MNYRIKKYLNFFIFLSLSGVLLFFAFKDVDLRFILKGFLEANFFWVILSLLVGIASHVIRSLRWQLLIEPLGKRPRLINTIGAVMIGYFANLALPRVGEVTRCGVLNKRENLPFESLLGTVIVERVSDLIMLVAITLVTILLKFNFFGKFIITNLLSPIKNRIQETSETNILAILGVTLVTILLAYFFISRFLGGKAKDRMRSILKGLANGLKAIGQMNSKWLFVVYTLLLWFCYWLMTYLLLFSIPATSDLGTADALFLLVAGSVGMLIPVQGGFGAFHIATALGLGLYGISQEEGLIFATVSHESQTLLIIAIGLFFVSLFMNRKATSKPLI